MCPVCGPARRPTRAAVRRCHARVPRPAPTSSDPADRMTLQGTAFLAMWHDIAAAAEPEYNLWHTREHMPERLGIPGFEVGRRYVDWNLDTFRYFTLYEGRSLDVFRSAPYLARLN